MNTKQLQVVSFYGINKHQMEMEAEAAQSNSDEGEEVYKIMSSCSRFECSLGKQHAARKHPFDDGKVIRLLPIDSVDATDCAAVHRLSPHLDAGHCSSYFIHIAC